MEIAQALIRSPLIVLTGAGASAPLRKLTTLGFLDLLSSSDAELQSRDKEAAQLLRKALHSARLESLDLEDVLARLESRAQVLDALAEDTELQREVINGDPTRTLAYRSKAIIVRDFIYDKIIEHYGAIDPSTSADLYRGLLGHLRQWTESVLGKPLKTLPFFTLNYDLAVEAACSALEVACLDGICTVRGRTDRRWVRTAFQDYREQEDLTVCLVKLHGSVRLGRREMADYGLGEDELVELASGMRRDAEPYTHAVIYPTRSPKGLTDEPFYTQYRVFNSCLQHAALIVIIGCSLRDPDVLIALRTALEDNAALRVLVVNPATDHESVSAAIHVPPDRVTVLQRKFTIEDQEPVNRGTSPFMGLLRGYLASAVGAPSANRAYVFGRTHAAASMPGQFPTLAGGPTGDD